MAHPCVQTAPLLLVCAFSPLTLHADSLTRLPDYAITQTNHQITQSPNHQILEQLVLDGATVYSREDVLWLLGLREGEPLSKAPDEIARDLQDRYVRDGYTQARVEAHLADGHLTLSVDEGRIDDIELVGLDERDAARLRDMLSVKAGDIYNKRTVGQAVEHLTAGTLGALRVGPGDIAIEHRAGRNVLVVPLQWRRSRLDMSFGTAGREDLFSNVDGLSPAVGFTLRLFDQSKLNHTFVRGYASYKFAREDAGYSLGFERPLFGGPRLFAGAELHDLSASDDFWRLSTAEQTLVSLFFKNSFRDYYRRRGAQLLAVFRPGPNNEFTLMSRWDRHEPLANATDYSVFRDDAEFRSNLLTPDSHVNAWILGYTLDTRSMSGAGEESTYERHLNDNLFGFGLRQQPGLRLEWRSELAGHGLGGDAHFERHIVSLRGYLALSDRQRVSARAIFGGSGGTLPVERRFALGGIGTVHGYRFKETIGTGMALVNAEYRLQLFPAARRDRDGFAVLGFYDAGRATGVLAGRDEWLHGIGFGLGLTSLRVEFGFRTNDIPRSRQILVRLGPTF